jgi:hypothetical protein
MYSVLLKTFLADDNGFGGLRQIVHLAKQIELPFPPQERVGIGLAEDSTINDDEMRISSVMWNHPRKEFHVKLQESIFAVSEFSAHPSRDAALAMIANGWRVELLMDWDTLREANENFEEDDNEAVISIDGRLFGAEPHEMLCLTAEGTKFTVVQSVGSRQLLLRAGLLTARPKGGGG